VAVSVGGSGLLIIAVSAVNAVANKSLQANKLITRVCNVSCEENVGSTYGSHGLSDRLSPEFSVAAFQGGRGYGLVVLAMSKLLFYLQVLRNLIHVYENG